MDITSSKIPKRIGSVKDAITLYNGRIHGEKLTHMPLHEDLHSKIREGLAKLDTGGLSESKSHTEKERSAAEFKPLNARNAAKELALQAEKSSAKAMAWKLGEETNHQYNQVVRELDNAKEELRELKLDVAPILEEKARAEKQIEISNARVRSYLSNLAGIRKEIEKANEEKAFIELATIEAERDLAEIEAQREGEATQFSSKIDNTRRRIKELYKEINLTKELEAKLAITNSDGNILQNEMQLIRDTETNFAKNDSLEDINIKEEESADAEFKEAKKELQCIRGEGFHLMDEMDFLRGELLQIPKEKEQLKKLDKDADSTIQCLNSKLLKTKSKLELASSAEERVKAIVSSLSVAMQQLQMDIEAGKVEKELSMEETNDIQIEIAKIDPDTDSIEETLRATLEELEAAKAAVAIALQKLRNMSEKTTRERASLLKCNSTITISRLEYDYLVNRAKASQELASKKVAAAQAWVEALEVGEEAVLKKTKIVEKEIRQLRVGKEEEVNMAKPRSSSSRISVESRRAKVRRSSISSGRGSITPSPPSTVRSKRKVVPNLVRFLRGQRIREKKFGSQS